MKLLSNTTKQDIEAATGHVIPAQGELENLDDATFDIITKQPYIQRELRAGNLVEGEHVEPTKTEEKSAKTDTKAKPRKGAALAGETISGA